MLVDIGCTRVGVGIGGLVGVPVDIDGTRVDVGAVVRLSNNAGGRGVDVGIPFVAISGLGCPGTGGADVEVGKKAALAIGLGVGAGVEVD